MEGGDPFGTPVIEAQRLCAAAAAGTIVVADAVRLLAGTGTDAVFEDAGELRLRGVVQPVRAWAVRWTAERMVAVPLAAALGVDEGTAFAGREAELAALRAAWTDAVAGRRRGVLVSGEPGIGKTRLAAEVAGHARERGGVVLYGRSDEGLAAAAQPFAEALGAYVAACPVDELRVQLGARAGDLVGLLPELDSRLPGIALSAPAEPEIERLHTLEAAAALLEAASEAAPVLLVLDDLHWADDLSLLLLRHVLRADPPVRLLLIAAYRDTEPSRSALLGEVVTGLARRPDVARLELGPLAEPDVAAIVAQAGRRPSLAEPRARRHRGQPVLRPRGAREPSARTAIRARRSLRGCATSCAGASPGCPTGRPTSLPPPRWRARTSTPTCWPTRSISTSNPLSTPWRLPSGRASCDPPGCWIASASRMRSCARRSGTSCRPAGACACTRGSRTRSNARPPRGSSRAVDLAAHFAAAGNPGRREPRPLRYTREAGDEAAARLAFDVAAEQYERSLSAHGRLPSAPQSERLDLELARGRALVLAGDDRGDPVLRRVAAAAETAGDGRRMAEALLTIRLEYADFIEEDAEMVALLRRALALLPAGDSAVRARLEGFLAQEAFSSVPDRERRAMIGRAVAMARRVRDPMALAAVLTSHSWIVAGPESVSERLAVADELVAAGREAGLPYAECDGQQWRMLALIELGEIEAVDAALAAAHAAVGTTKSRWTVGYLDTVRALLAGRFADAEAAVARGREAARETTAPQALAESAFVRLLSCVRIVQGRLTEYEPAREAMAQGITNLPPTFFVVRAHAARERHDRDGAREAFERAISQRLLEHPRGPTWLIPSPGPPTSAPGLTTAPGRCSCSICSPPSRTR